MPKSVILIYTSQMHHFQLVTSLDIIFIYFSNVQNSIGKISLLFCQISINCKWIIGYALPLIKYLIYLVSTHRPSHKSPPFLSRTVIIWQILIAFVLPLRKLMSIFWIRPIFLSISTLPTLSSIQISRNILITILNKMRMLSSAKV